MRNDTRKKPVVSRPAVWREDSDDDGGEGGQTVPFQWEDPWLTHPLSPEEQQALNVHAERQASHVKDAKVVQDQRAAAREHRGEFRQGAHGGLGYGQSSGHAAQFAAHPVLKDKVQFSGIDKEESPLADQFENETNQDAQHDLALRLEKQLSLQNQPSARPHLTPRPSPL